MTIEERRKQRAAAGLGQGEEIQPEEIEKPRADVIPRKSKSAKLIDAGRYSLQELFNMIQDVKEAFEIENGIKEWRKETPAMWSAFCMRSGREVFKSGKTGILKSTELKPSGACVASNCGGAYDENMVEGIYIYYQEMALAYEMPIRLYDFANFSGIPYRAIQSDLDRVSRLVGDFCEKINKDNEYSLEALAIGGKRSTVGVLASLNHRHGWAQTKEIIHTKSDGIPTAQELPRLAVDD